MSKLSIGCIVRTIKEQFPEYRVTVSEQFDGFQQTLAKLTFDKLNDSTCCYLKCFVREVANKSLDVPCG